MKTTKLNITILVTAKVSENLGFYHAETGKQIWVSKGIDTFAVNVDLDEYAHKSGDILMEQSVREVLQEMSNNEVHYEFIQQVMVFGEMNNLTEKVMEKFQTKRKELVIK